MKRENDGPREPGAPERTAGRATWSPRRIGVIGAGAMGVSLAALLGRAGAGSAVTLVCRDARRAAALAQRGAVVHGKLEGSSRPAIVRRIADLAEGGGASAIFVATKTTAIDQVADELRPILGGLGDAHGPPFVVSFQNGIESGRCLMERLGYPRIIRMVLNYGARLCEDGSVFVASSQPPHRIGSPNPACGAACGALAALLTSCGLETEAVDDIEPYVWMKGLANASMSPVAALLDATVGESLDSPAGRIVSRLLAEGLAVAAADGIELGAEARGRLERMLEAARPHTPSMVEDIRAGRMSEVGQLNRQVIAHAARVGVSVPTHEAIAALIDAFDWRVFRRTGTQQRISA